MTAIFAVVRCYIRELVVAGHISTSVDVLCGCPVVSIEFDRIVGKLYAGHRN